MDLADLNIVAIAPPPKAQPLKRKKTNKYERRRQKAEAAKRQQKQHHSKGSKAIVAANNEEPKHTAPESNDISPAGGNGKSTMDSALTPVPTPTPAEGDSVQLDRPTQQSAVESPSVAPSEPAATSSTRRRPIKSSSSLTADLEHAKYMAEFHARPMELDRRSGVARKGAIVSKSSMHLFDAEDWNSLDLHPRLIQTLESSKFRLAKPTSVQSRSIATFHDPQNAKRNILIHGETGSGKTLAYLLPILQRMGVSKDDDSGKIATKPSRKELGTKCLILCPTRELASQTLTVVEKLCQANFAGWMVPGGLLGGDSRNSEKSRIRKGLGIIVATPGRLLDHLQKTESLLLNLKGKLQWLVLDEADRLLDMGLGDQVKQIVQLIRANEASKSQPWWRSVLVSATVTPSVQALAKERILCGVQDWVWVKGGGDRSSKKTPESSSAIKDSAETADVTDQEKTSSNEDKDEGYSESTPHQLAQFHITVTAKLRLSTLISFLVQQVSEGQRTVVFMGTCACVDFHHQLFASMESLWVDDDNDEDGSEQKTGLFGRKAQVFKLHGNVEHSKRNQTLKLFDKVTGGAVLLTTDVAARGINLEGVDWIVQYDPPCEIADYVHRVGRVARAGKAGNSLLFLLPSEKGYLDVLQTKGISKIEPLSLASTLNKAASLCPDWTNAGLKHGGNKEFDHRPKGGQSLQGSRLGEHFAGEVQRRLEDCIVQEHITTQQKWKEEKKANKKRRKDAPNKPKEGELMELARSAFMSFLRAYPTKREPSVRSIFSARALHVGHVARSFALKDPPKSLVSKHRQNQNAQKTELEVADKQANRPKSLQFNPYENNLVSLSDEDKDTDDEAAADHGGNRRSKRRKVHPAFDTPKAKNAKTLLLQNAMKMQSNLMDAM